MTRPLGPKLSEIRPKWVAPAIPRNPRAGAGAHPAAAPARETFPFGTGGRAEAESISSLALSICTLQCKTDVQ